VEASRDDDAGLASTPRSAAGISRFRSRFCMKASYFAAGAGRGVRWHAAGSCRDGIAHAARKFLVNGSTAGQRSARERDGNDGGDMAGSDRHRGAQQP